MMLSAMSLSVPPGVAALIKGSGRYNPPLSRMSTVSTASTESSITLIPPGAMSTASTMTLPTFEAVFPTAGRAISRFSFPRLRIGPPPVPDAKLLTRIATLAYGTEEATTAAYAAAMVGVRRYAAAYKTSVPQRSVGSVTTDESVFAAQAAWTRGLHDTAVASARCLLRWVEASSPSSSSSSAQELEASREDARVVQSALEDALLASVCMYTGFLEHETLPAPLDTAVQDMEANLATAASSLDGLATLLRIGHCAVLHVERYRLAAVDQATLVYGLLRKFVHAIVAARDHQERCGRDVWDEERFRRTTWDTTVILLKTHLLLFKLSVAISGLFVNEIRRYRDFSQDENPKPSHADIRSVEYGGWADKARDSFWDVVDLMLSVAQEHGVGVLTRVEEVAEETDAEESEEGASDEEVEEGEEGDEVDDEEETDIDATEDEPEGLDKTLLAQLLLSFMRFREVMEGVWDNHSSEQFEASFDRFTQPPVYEEETQDDGSVRMVPTADRNWEGWDKLGVELCRGMSKAELAEFEEHNLDPGLHKRWRARLRKESRPRRSHSSEKRRADHSDEDEDEGGRVKRRKSYR
ncbi:hypothetical protein CC85DRAFT_330972 [Cutaneotrichosporon oleaginosum]|uniref:Uncharacterized protein n=1 Tax=Cutaneotrichosporon oleaginosum TaxID=879819 RepID=A0A0J0XDS2_9TREE|nr:uncharacterized protein CC85DRAFT_330972 [Cutaneotrichosporon oleaginosum]KLT39168.1 hypothetical protein CC85DRAFT_330972 [Cutaneotrichosporon oleaginosum]TXT05314.1 hypothetical protein COLE_06634 [Cutaneotrichosporon oleaginosum]